MYKLTSWHYLSDLDENRKDERMFEMMTLKPCPFCGGKAMAALGRGNCAIVFCGNGCSVEMRSELNMGKYEAIPFDVLNDAFTKAALMWNTRSKKTM